MTTRELEWQQLRCHLCDIIFKGVDYTFRGIGLAAALMLAYGALSYTPSNNSRIEAVNEMTENGMSYYQAEKHIEAIK